MTDFDFLPLVGTMGLWMYFWDSGDWVAPGAGQVPVGSLMLLGVGRVLLFGLLAKEVLGWICN